MAIATKVNSSKDKDMEQVLIEIVQGKLSLMENGSRTNLFTIYDFYFIIK